MMNNISAGVRSSQFRLSESQKKNAFRIDEGISLHFHGFRWIPVDFDGFHWIPMTFAESWRQLSNRFIKDLLKINAFNSCF